MNKFTNGQEIKVISGVTWGLMGKGRERMAVVFCMDCREQLSKPIPPHAAKEEQSKAQASHACKLGK
jgi:hypothetical protein